MKAIIKNSGSAVKFLLVLCILFFATQSASAQGKPKGPAWPAPASAISVKNPVASNATSLKDGKEIYNKNCKSCHGENGKGDGTKAGTIDISCGDFTAADFKKITDGELFWKITTGRKPMPTFEKKLTDSERWSVVNYIKSLH